jgi:hypothetical protein
MKSFMQYLPPRTKAYMEMAKMGTLPPNFSLWALSTPFGWSIAHTAASYGTLPSSFEDWQLSDYKGTTVADVAEARKLKRIA